MAFGKIGKQDAFMIDKPSKIIGGERNIILKKDLLMCHRHLSLLRAAKEIFMINFICTFMRSKL
jgi:hypothetical protein